MDDFITPQMPGWVDPPGSSPFVAAYPEINVDIIEDSTEVTIAAKITGEEVHTAGETYGYGTTNTIGTSVSVGRIETHTWQDWVERGNSIADSTERSQYQGQMVSEQQQFARTHTAGRAAAKPSL